MNNEIIPENEKTPLPIITYIILFVASAAMAGLAAISPLSLYAILFYVLAASCTAFASAISKKLFPVLAFIPAFAIAYLLTGKIYFAVYSIVFIPCAFILFTVSQCKISRSVAFVSLAVVFTAVIFSFSYIELKYSYPDTPVIETIKGFINSTTEELKKYIAEYEIEISSEALSETVLEMVLMIPGLLVAMAEIFAYFTTFVYKLVAKIFSREDEVIPQDFKLYLSLPSAVVYLALIIFGIFATKGTAFYVVINLSEILLFPFVWVGAREFKNYIKNAQGRRKVIIIVVSIALVLIGFYMFLYALAILASVSIIRNAIMEKIKDKNDKNGGGDNNSDGYFDE